MPNQTWPPVSKQCDAAADADGGTLVCFLPVDHGGLHYDEVEGISWVHGKPDPNEPDS